MTFNLQELEIKKPHSKSDYTEKNLLELMNCMEDPLYFMRNFMKARHPIKGSVMLDPYSYQIKLVNAFRKHRFNCVLAGRQLGKSNTYDTIIKIDDKRHKIGNLIPLSLKDKIVALLEYLLLKIVTL